MDPEQVEWRRFIVPGVIVAVLLTLAVIAPEIYTGTFSDLGTFLLVALTIAVLAVYSLGVKRFVDNQVASTAMVAVPALIAVAVFVWPYVRPATEVDEAFPPTAAPFDAAASVPTSSIAEPEPTVTDPEPEPTVTVAEPADAASTDAADAEAAAPAEQTQTTTPATTTTIAPTTIAPTTTPAPTTTVQAGPIELRRGTFQGLTGHRGSGDAALYSLADGSILLRFEEVDIGSGPALDVYLVPGADQRGTGDGIYVAPLTAERGNQNYTPPPGVDLTTGTWTVLVWCETFDVEVANTTFTA